MSAELIMRPGITVASRGDFISSHPPYAVALDGYVNAPPFFVWTPDGEPYCNFDHHSGVNRFATRSSAQQALFAVRTGFVRAFTADGEYGPTVYANDCDQDVSLAWFVLKNAPEIASHRIKKVGAPIRNLVDMAGDLDVTAGAYPQPVTLPLMRQIAWIFRPFTQARVRGELTGDTAHYQEIVAQCCGRIGLHLAGQGREVRLDTRYQTIGGGENWTMFREIGAEGRIGAFRNGIDAFAIYKGQRPNGRHDYAIGRISEYIDFNLPMIVRHMNRLEGLIGPDRWGCDGSGIVGGSPRGMGSGIDPQMFIETINDLSPTYSRR